MFVRKKKIKGIEYAYVVKNKWCKRKKYPRQKVAKYLGKVFKFKRIRNKSIIDFSGFHSIDEIFELPYDEIISLFVALELHNHGFSRKRNSYIRDNLKVNISSKTVECMKIIKNCYRERAVRSKLPNKSKSSNKSSNKLKSTKTRAVIQINEGFLCSYTLRNLFNFKIKKSRSDIEEGRRLAALVVGSGIRLNQDEFVRLFFALKQNFKNA